MYTNHSKFIFYRFLYIFYPPVPVCCCQPLSNKTRSDLGWRYISKSTNFTKTLHQTSSKAVCWAPPLLPRCLRALKKYFEDMSCPNSQRMASQKKRKEEAYDGCSKSLFLISAKKIKVPCATPIVLHVEQVIRKIHVKFNKATSWTKLNKVESPKCTQMHQLNENVGTDKFFFEWLLDIRMQEHHHIHQKKSVNPLQPRLLGPLQPWLTSHSASFRTHGCPSGRVLPTLPQWLPPNVVEPLLHYLSVATRLGRNKPNPRFLTQPKPANKKKTWRIWSLKNSKARNPLVKPSYLEAHDIFLLKFLQEWYFMPWTSNSSKPFWWQKNIKINRILPCIPEVFFEATKEINT